MTSDNSALEKTEKCPKRNAHIISFYLRVLTQGLRFPSGPLLKALSQEIK